MLQDPRGSRTCWRSHVQNSLLWFIFSHYARGFHHWALRLRSIVFLICSLSDLCARYENQVSLQGKEALVKDLLSFCAKLQIFSPQVVEKFKFPVSSRMKLSRIFVSSVLSGSLLYRAFTLAVKSKSTRQNYIGPASSQPSGAVHCRQKKAMSFQKYVQLIHSSHLELPDL